MLGQQGNTTYNSFCYQVFVKRQHLQRKGTRAKAHFKNGKEGILLRKEHEGNQYVLMSKATT